MKTPHFEIHSDDEGNGRSEEVEYQEEQARGRERRVDEPAYGRMGRTSRTEGHDINDDDEECKDESEDEDEERRDEYEE